MLDVTFIPHRSALRSATDEPQKLFAMLKLIPQGETAGARPPLAVALLIDTSGSMRDFADQEEAIAQIERLGLHGPVRDSDGRAEMSVDLGLPTKLDRAIEAAHALANDERLAGDDRLAIVHFNEKAQTLLPLTAVSERSLIHEAIERLRGGAAGTYMGRGLGLVREELRGVSPHVAKRALVLTDGQTSDEDQCRRVSDELAGENTPIVAIGLGEEYNETLMRDMADATQGRPYHLRDIRDFPAYLETEIGSVVREVVTDLQATVALADGVRLESVTRVYPSLAEATPDDSAVRLGNVAAGDHTVFVFEFTVSEVSRSVASARIATLSMVADVPGLGEHRILTPLDLAIDFTTDESAIVEVDAEVLGYVQQKNVDRMMREAVDLSSVDAGRARQTLQMAAGLTRRLGNTSVTMMIETALDELDSSGSISPGTRRTVALGGRTQSVRVNDTRKLHNTLSEEEIRRVSGA